MSEENDAENHDLGYHQISWSDFDSLARGEYGVEVVRELRRAERSRRLLLLRALVDIVAKAPELSGPLPSPDAALELLARVERKSPETFDLMLAHPYTGTWAGYTTHLLHNRIAGVCPTWLHIGYLHALAAAAAVRAGLDFEMPVPAWNGDVILPTIGLAHLATDSPCSVATVRGEGRRYHVGNPVHRVRLPDTWEDESPDWYGIRRLEPRVGRDRLPLRLDDVDPYRGLYEPVPPQRLDDAEVVLWWELLDGAWRLIVRHLPEVAATFPAGLESMVPRPPIPFRTPSASSGEAFGSALLARPPDAAALAAMLVHEFRHICLGGVLHLARLYEDDQRERFHVPWRDDPRPIGGTLQGVYAFTGVTAFWRAVFRSDTPDLARRAGFEFAYWRAATWNTLQELRADPGLTGLGRRFVSGVAQRLGPWQDEPVPAEPARAAELAVADHRAGWRLRYLRPSDDVVRELARAWLSGATPAARPHLALTRSMAARSPTPVPDGAWSTSREDLVRLVMSQGQAEMARQWRTVPGATAADFAYASGQYATAAHGYRAELAADGDRPASWIGLGLSLSAQGNADSGRMLLRCPELVRAVHRKIRHTAPDRSSPDDLAAWIAQIMY